MMMWGGFGGYGMPWGYGLGWIGLMFMLLFWGGMFYLGYRLITAMFPAPGGGRGHGGAGASGSGAKAILDERYARGEISQEDYQRMLKDIQG